MKIDIRLNEEARIAVVVVAIAACIITFLLMP